MTSTQFFEEGFDEEDYGVGGRKGDYALMEAINKALDECKADGTTSEIFKEVVWRRPN